jgi:hypothetical protein
VYLKQWLKILITRLRSTTLRSAVEVKQIEPNADDRQIMEHLAHGNAASQWVNMSRARQSILDAAMQLRAHVQDRQPGLVVLYEVTGLFGYLGGDNIAQCLYGPERIHVAVPTDPGGEPWVLGGSYGGRRIATERHNRTLSAVAVLTVSAKHETLSVFHNVFATRPIEPERFRFEGVRHFAWRSASSELLPRWVEVTATAAKSLLKRCHCHLSCHWRRLSKDPSSRSSCLERH